MTITRRRFLAVTGSVVATAVVAAMPLSVSSGLVFRGDLTSVYRRDGQEFTVAYQTGGQFGTPQSGWVVRGNAPWHPVVRPPHNLGQGSGIITATQVWPVEKRAEAEKFAETCVFKEVEQIWENTGYHPTTERKMIKVDMVIVSPNSVDR